MIRITLVAAVVCTLPLAAHAHSPSSGALAPAAASSQSKIRGAQAPAAQKASAEPRSRRAGDRRSASGDVRERKTADKIAHKAVRKRNHVAFARSSSRDRKAASPAIPMEAERDDAVGARKAYAGGRFAGSENSGSDRISGFGEKDENQHDKGPKFALPVATYSGGRSENRVVSRRGGGTGTGAPNDAHGTSHAGPTQKETSGLAGVS